MCSGAGNWAWRRGFSRRKRGIGILIARRRFRTSRVCLRITEEGEGLYKGGEGVWGVMGTRSCIYIPGLSASERLTEIFWEGGSRLSPRYLSGFVRICWDISYTRLFIVFVISTACWKYHKQLARVLDSWLYMEDRTNKRPVHIGRRFELQLHVVLPATYLQLNLLYISWTDIRPSVNSRGLRQRTSKKPPRPRQR